MPYILNGARRSLMWMAFAGTVIFYSSFYNDVVSGTG